MKLSYKRTFLVGLAFFSICAFWQLYDGVVPLILRDHFGVPDGPAGIVMSIDNILALFMLPLFGALSDRAGRRMPFIIIGTAVAVTLTVLLPVAANSGSLLAFFIALGLVLIAMGSYRSPAVALMPSVTPKPLRSQANAIINLMGAVGGVYTLLMMRVLVKTPEEGLPDYMPLFLSVAALMVLSVVLLVVSIREKMLVAQMEAIHYGADPEAEAAETVQREGEKAKLPPDVRRSLTLILISVSLWFMGYNAVTTAFTKYATSVWGQNIGQASTCLMIATVGAVISYIPIGMISSKIGRKRTILMGIVVLSACFAVGAFAASRFSPALYVMFAMVGFAWAAINVNSYPMVVEISRAGDIGKYTGYYYTFSMAAQVVTPILSGYLLQYVGYHTLFPYAALMVGAAFVTMLLTRHGDNKPAPKANKLEHFDVED